MPKIVKNIIQASHNTINIIENNNESSASSDSCSSISEPKVKRRRKVTYLNGDGEKNWTPVSQLMFNEIDLMKKLKSFRELNVACAENSQVLNDVRVLSLSHIFPFVNEEEDRCVVPYLGRAKDAFVNLVNQMISPEMPEVSDAAVLLCHKASKTNDFYFEPKNQTDALVLGICTEHKQSRFCVEDNSEAAFFFKHLMPLLDKVLLAEQDKNTIVTMMDSPCVEGKKPDFAFGTKKRGKKMYLFFVEVKREEAQSKYQAESDYVKLLKQMKASVDMQLKMGVLTPRSFGLLCEGYRCCMFEMVLAAEGVYLCSLLRKFSLVKDAADLVHVPAIVETLQMTKNQLQDLKAIIAKAAPADRKRQANLVKRSFTTCFEK